MVCVVTDKTVPKLLVMPRSMVFAPTPRSCAELIEFLMRKHAGKLLLDNLPERQALLPAIIHPAKDRPRPSTMLAVYMGSNLLKYIFRQGKTCFIPRYQLQSNHMDMVKLVSPEEIASLPRTSWNIQQPSEDEVLEEALSTGGLDLIFEPGLGFNKQSNHLGWGKGYYDAYLKRCLQSQDVKPYTLALVFKEQICLQVPVDENDVKVD